MKKGEKGIRAFWGFFLEFEIGADRFSIEFYIK